MSTPNPKRHEKLLKDLAELKLHRIAEIYQEVLDEAARKQSSMLDVLEALVAEEAAVCHNRALLNRIKRAHLPPRKTLESYDFTWPKRIPKQSILRLFDCDFVVQQACAVFIGPTGTGKSHLLNALGYNACEKGFSVRFTRVVEPCKRTCGTTPGRNFCSSMSWAICRSTNAARTCCSRSWPPGTNPARWWSAPTAPSGTGARPSTWTTPWPPP